MSILAYHFRPADDIGPPPPTAKTPNPKRMILWFEVARSGHAIQVVDPTGDKVHFEIRISSAESEGRLLASCWHMESGCPCDPTVGICDAAWLGALSEARIYLRILDFVADHPPNGGSDA